MLTLEQHNIVLKKALEKATLTLSKIADTRIIRDDDANKQIASQALIEINEMANRAIFAGVLPPD